MTIIKNFPYILHGGDWNPDQWLEHPEIIDQDFELMDKAHCNTFSLGIFSWGQIEVEEGKYDFKKSFSPPPPPPAPDGWVCATPKPLSPTRTACAARG